jgi:hypothetical protein
MAANKLKKSAFESELQRRVTFIESFRNFDAAWKTDAEKFVDTVMEKYKARFGDTYGYKIVRQCVKEWGDIEEIVEEAMEKVEEEKCDNPYAEKGMTPISHTPDDVFGIKSLERDIANKNVEITNLKDIIQDYKDALEKPNWKIRLALAGGFVASFLIGCSLTLVILVVFQ